MYHQTDDSVYLFASNLTNPIHFKTFDSKTAEYLLEMMDILDPVENEVDSSVIFVDYLLKANIVIKKQEYFAFVCAHKNMDERCGVCGPQVYIELTKLIELLNFESEVVPLNVGQISHVGGHKYAGNLLIYPPGDMYGHVTQANVLDIVKTHILSRNIATQNWRGRMGVAPEKLPELLQTLHEAGQASHTA